MFVIDARTLETAPFVASMTREASGCGFVLVCSTLAPTLMLEGMRAGIRECVPEPIDPVGTSEPAVVSGWPPRAPPTARSSRSSAPRGASGTTTTAVNVAID